MDVSQKYKKPLLITGGVLAVFILYRVIVGKIDNSGSQYDTTGNGNSAPIDAQAIAETLYNAMKISGTDEQAIKNALQPVNATQFKQIVTAFGQRSYNKTMGNIYEYFGNTLNKYGLKEWLKNELNASEYETLRLKYPTEL
ncbi:hypothetical protein DVK85_01315 [Flavobacterium arcticum]|uniref:Annexin n=1 Tax=Flavobacterium arcticum TaxID=1784713 RepID=A0A345H8N1_9FLAO|nr:hypothetical protein [Flavobacterium arcticum]AXG72941.1 hypothetical protein DVK85_01315 [Flavobacterium arcticum]KAF2510395.1 annexin [Flavobacterium arcticum]